MQAFSSDFYSRAEKEYDTLKQKLSNHFRETYLPENIVYRNETDLLPFLKRELNRIKLQHWFRKDPQKEIKKVIQFFYYRERGEKVLYHNMNPYIREFLNKQNASIFRDPPFNGKPLHEALVDLLGHRLKLPTGSPEEIFKFWLPDQFEMALNKIPEPILEEGGFGKVCRVIGGVFLYALTGLDHINTTKEATSRMNQAIRGGYYFGMFYPLVDDILDHPEILNEQEKEKLIELLEYWIVGDFSVENTLLIHPSMLYLEQIFKDFHKLFPLESNQTLYRSALMLFFAQVDDGKKSFENIYTPEEIYVPIIIKAAYTRILAASISGIEITDHLLDHMKKIGLNLQLMDDFRDWFSDYNIQQFTPFTYYMKGKAKQQINPFSMYLASLRIHFSRFNNDHFQVNLLMRRLIISIQKLDQDNSDHDVSAKIWSVISQNPTIGNIIKKIHQLNYKVFDPDTEFTKPVDHVINRGR